MAERYALDFTTGDYFLETPANPAAGTDFALTWAQPTLIYIKSISSILTTAVAAANKSRILKSTTASPYSYAGVQQPHTSQPQPSATSLPQD